MNIGDPIPVFSIQKRDKTIVSSHSYIGKQNVVVYFYPKDETKVCTAQACAFRDQYQDFLDLDCEVIGISSDSEQSHEHFSAHHRLPFLLISDRDKSIRRLFQVPKDVFGLLPGRYTYVFNKKGLLVNIFHSAFNAQSHIDAALESLRSSVD